MQIIGISLIRNEDIFIERVLRNAVDFCDKLLVVDNNSTDNTWEIVTTLARSDPRIEPHRARRASRSHALIQAYAGTDTWIFPVDGDEIYDPHRLHGLRQELLAGTHAQWWGLFCHMLHCTRIDDAGRQADGYAAPPSRTGTRLFNFGAIHRWAGPCKERLHGGKILFRSGYSDALRDYPRRQASWDESPFRCLHVCFLRRSSRDPADGTTRMNPQEAVGRLGTWGGALRRWLGRGRAAGYKREKYMRGDLVRQVDVSAFFGGAWSHRSWNDQGLSIRR